MFWWKHFDITSDFLFISDFFFFFELLIQTKGTSLGLRVVCIKLAFHRPCYLWVEFAAFKFQYSTDSFISFLCLLMLNDLLWFSYCFLNVFSLISLKFLGWWFFLSDFNVTIYRMFSDFYLRGRCICWYKYIFGYYGLLVCLIFFCYVYNFLIWCWVHMDSLS